MDLRAQLRVNKVAKGAARCSVPAQRLFCHAEINCTELKTQKEMSNYVAERSGEGKQRRNLIENRK
jgi:hypothetical protein